MGIAAGRQHSNDDTALPQRGPDPAARTLVLADRILTPEGDATAMLLEGERIVATGRAEELERIRPEDARPLRRVDYRGGAIMPGINDAHVHLTMMVLMAQGVDLSPETTPDEAALREKLWAAASAAGPGAWVRGSRYDHMRSTGGAILHRDVLDRWFPEHPVVIGHVGAHWGVANSRALAAAGVDERTPDPFGGSYGRETDGRLTGSLSEQAYFDFAYPSLTERPGVCARFGDSAVDLLERSAERLLAAGITSIGDAMVGLEEWELLSAAREAGRLPVRVNALITFPNIAELRRRGISSGHGDDWLRVGGVKMFTDGAVAGRSCAVAEPFEGGGGDRGVLTTDVERLTALVVACREAGLAPAIHANGERAIEMALAAIEAAGPGRGDYPDRLEHCSIVTDALLRRIRALGIAAVPFAGYPYYHGENLLRWYGADRLERMFAHRSMLDLGIAVAGSSDYPCGPLNPFDGLQSLVTRTSAEGSPAGLSQRISVEEAIALYTAGSAEVERQSHRKGRLAPGQLADFVVIDRDPRAVDPFELSRLAVQAAWVSGEPRWERTSAGE
ncbi:MAG: amidohydrolase [Leucobacter sp.]